MFTPKIVKLAVSRQADTMHISSITVNTETAHPVPRASQIIMDKVRQQPEAVFCEFDT
jgi:hypothetical protein